MLHRNLLFFLIITVCIAPSYAHAVDTAAPKFPRFANYFLRTVPDINPASYDLLARYDLLILPMEAQKYNPEFFSYARKKNHDIIILPYVPSRSINIIDIEDGAQIRKRLKAGIKDEWYLRSSMGSIVSAWPGTIPINVTAKWNEYLPKFLTDTILSTGLWDGIFYDEFQDSMTYLNHGDIDLDGDSLPDGQAHADRLWAEGNETLLRNTRALIGADKIIITNGSSLGQYHPYVNGRMYENFPTSRTSQDQWAPTMHHYLNHDSKSRQPLVLIINTTTLNSGRFDDYQGMRYGLATALLGDGLYAFDFGDRDHGQLWHYDEYEMRLGTSVGNPQRLDVREHMAQLAPGVWMREFQYGAAVVNSLSTHASVELGADFEKLKGSQDPRTNDGSIVSVLDINPSDGILVYRPLQFIWDIPFLNASFVRVLSHSGEPKRNGFFAYDSNDKGSSLVLAQSSKHHQTVSAYKQSLTIKRPDGSRATVIPFDDPTVSKISFTVSDSDEDGSEELIVAPSERTSQRHNKKKELSPSQVLIYDLETLQRKRIVTPFGKHYRGGISVAAGNVLEGDDIEIVAAKGKGYEPHIVVLSHDGSKLKEFNAYHKRMKFGVSVAVGNTDGLGLDEIITAPKKGAAPHIRLFTGTGESLSPGFYATNKQKKGGLFLGAADVDHDGVDEILAMTEDVFTIAAVSPK